MNESQVVLYSFIMGLIIESIIYFFTTLLSSFIAKVIYDKYKKDKFNFAINIKNAIGISLAELIIIFFLSLFAVLVYFFLLVYSLFTLSETILVFGFFFMNFINLIIVLPSIIALNEGKGIGDSFRKYFVNFDFFKIFFKFDIKFYLFFVILCLLSYFELIIYELTFFLIYLLGLFFLKKDFVNMITTKKEKNIYNKILKIFFSILLILTYLFWFIIVIILPESNFLKGNIELNFFQFNFQFNKLNFFIIFLTSITVIIPPYILGFFDTKNQDKKS